MQMFGGNMKALRSLTKRIRENFASGMSFIEIHGSRELILSGCKRIIDYNTEKISCDTLSGHLTVEGKCLQVDIFSGDILTVCGIISGVYLNRDNDC